MENQCLVPVSRNWFSRIEESYRRCSCVRIVPTCTVKVRLQALLWKVLVNASERQQSVAFADSQITLIHESNLLRAFLTSRDTQSPTTLCTDWHPVKPPKRSTLNFDWQVPDHECCLRKSA